MEWLQQWIANRQKRQELNNQNAVNPIVAVDAATLWQNASNSNEGAVTGGPGTTSGPVITEVPGTNNTSQTTTNPEVDTTFTEGPGTKLIQKDDGTVIRVPIDQEVPGSKTIQKDLEEPENEI